MKTLCIVLNETRGAEITLPSLASALITPLNACLGYSGGIREGRINPYSRFLDFDWSVPEPEDWIGFFEEKYGGGLWASLVGRVDSCGFGQTPEEVSLWTSGLIGLWFRLHACENILDNNLESEYDWFAFVRSDFFWEHPINTLSQVRADSLVVLQGEEYGGLNDRFALISRSLIREYRDVVAGMFTSSDTRLLAAALAWKRTKLKFNPESYWLMMLRRKGLESKIFKIPYLGYLIRSEQEQSRWSDGFYWIEKAVYVKYPTELLRCRLVESSSLSRQLRDGRLLPLGRPARIKVLLSDFFSRLAGRFPRTILFPTLRYAFGIRFSNCSRGSDAGLGDTLT